MWIQRRIEVVVPCHRGIVLSAHRQWCPVRGRLGGMLWAMTWLSADLAGRTALVTGASTGIGLETAKGLAQRGARLWLVSRDPDRGREALQQVDAVSRVGETRLLLQDLGSQDGVRAAALEFLESGDPLHILVNNAAAVFFERQETKDGIEATFALNHLAPFYLTLLLLDRMLSSSPARIINVSSAGHTQGRIRFDDLQAKNRYFGFSQYCNTKLANILFTYELARRIEGTGVVAHSLHPGVFRSSLGMNNRGLVRRLWEWVHPLMSSPEKAAETSIFLASASEIQERNGGYWSNCRERRSSSRSYDRAVAERLWRVSEELVAVPASQIGDSARK